MPAVNGGEGRQEGKTMAMTMDDLRALTEHLYDDAVGMADAAETSVAAAHLAIGDLVSGLLSEHLAMWSDGYEARVEGAPDTVEAV
jgi:hypothetical protein